MGVSARGVSAGVGVFGQGSAWSGVSAWACLPR